VVAYDYEKNRTDVKYGPGTQHPGVAKPIEELSGNPLELFAIWMRELRRRTGFSQSMFAEVVPCSGATISMWETGESYASAQYHTKLKALGRKLGMPDMPKHPEMEGPRRKSAYFDPKAHDRFVELFGEPRK
jgi:DNA-binding XRE family transcriptional regulator